MDRPSVLIAEDNPGLARVIAYKFKAAGFEVRVAHDGKTAWEMFQAEPADTIVSDQEMPGKTGVELCRCVRELDRSVPFFLVTGRQLELSVTGVANELKLNGMFAKPFSPASIVEEVTAALDLAKQPTITLTESASTDSLKQAAVS